MRIILPAGKEDRITIITEKHLSSTYCGYAWFSIAVPGIPSRNLTSRTLNPHLACAGCSGNVVQSVNQEVLSLGVGGTPEDRRSSCRVGCEKHLLALLMKGPVHPANLGGQRPFPSVDPDSSPV